jgi:hypothetical protein
MSKHRDPLLASLNASLNSPAMQEMYDRIYGRPKPKRKPAEKKPATPKPAAGQTSFI